MTLAVAIVSGGMDSTTLAYRLADEGHDLIVLSADYGQRHRVELQYAEDTARSLGAEWHLVDLRSITGLLSSSALTNPDIPVPEGHYAEDTMRITVVPNRNAILLDIAVAVAVDRGARLVATAVHAGDHAVYPDCRPEFLEAFANMARIANEGFIHPGFGIAAPYQFRTKAEIAHEGDGYGVPWQSHVVVLQRRRGPLWCLLHLL